MFGEKITANIDKRFVHKIIVFVYQLENGCIVDA